mmetsp:Transcript_14410/g.45274  ORF Transcript_14410/g.45274 Transcript_14410/m.45274 type:complete len:243 (-) Transcript_14410:107-835(-)
MAIEDDPIVLTARLHREALARLCCATGVPQQGLSHGAFLLMGMPHSSNEEEAPRVGCHSGHRAAHHAPARRLLCPAARSQTREAGGVALGSSLESSDGDASTTDLHQPVPAVDSSSGYGDSGIEDAFQFDWEPLCEAVPLGFRREAGHQGREHTPACAAHLWLTTCACTAWQLTSLATAPTTAPISAPAEDDHTEPQATTDASNNASDPDTINDLFDLMRPVERDMAAVADLNRSSTLYASP